MIAFTVEFVSTVMYYKVLCTYVVCIAMRFIELMSLMILSL